MTNAQRLDAVRAIHTAIYLVMAAGTFAILFAGVTGAHGLWLWIALVLLAVETAVFAASGMRCPLTAVAEGYASGALVSDTFFPRRLTRHTVKVFGPLLALGVGLLAARLWFGLGVD